ncbi:MAG: class I SAM-dependent methyltransferase [Candidatus Aureabacteria bacterium]|nr:class I SAM-dependent methyltransferase [Candidatus Auribacterota bacterium]
MGNRSNFFYDTFNHPGFFNFVRHIVDGGQVAPLRAALRNHGVRSVLDIGCGTGHFCPVADGEYLGIDGNPRFIDYARRKHGGPSKHFLVMDIRSMDFGERRFDAGIIVDTLHHLSDDEAAAAIADAGRFCRLVVIHDWLPPGGNPFRALMAILDRGAYVRGLNEQETLVAQAGGRVLETTTFWSISRLYHHSIIVAESGKTIT